MAERQKTRDMKTEIQTDGKAGQQTNGEANRSMAGKPDTSTARQKERQLDGKTGKKRDELKRQTDTSGRM